MTFRKVFYLFSVLILLSLSLFGTDPVKKKIDRQLIESAEKGHNQIEYLIVLKHQAVLPDVKSLSKKEKGRTIYNLLNSFARVHQKSLITFLEEKNVRYNPYFVVNAIWVQSDPDMMYQIAARDDVRVLAHNPWVRLQIPEEEKTELTQRSPLPEWGILKIKADSVWKLGFRGAGVVVAGQDTGYEWDVTPLREKYRGFGGGSADHNYNWHDAIREPNPRFPPENLNPCGLGLLFPCDDDNHGTHTMGTMVGEDENNAIGVAPEAKWIACRNMDRAWGKPSTYIECFEWFLAPTDLQGLNPDPDMSPHVINNSWACPEDEGCNPSNWEVMELVVKNLTASGVMVVVSAGNSGSRGCGSIDTPAPMFEASFTVGSTRQNDTISGFSSRGPVIVDESFRLKPDIVAPGHGVRSVVRGGGFAAYSGTSMAGPHVAGLVALLISANPALAGEVEVLSRIIRTSAVPLTAEQDCFDYSGMDIPNATYGYGRIDAMQALKMALDFTQKTKDDKVLSGIKLYPNPAAQNITFLIENAEEAIRTLTLFDFTGRIILEKSRSSDSNVLFAELQAINSGPLFYIVRTDKSVYTGKFIKL
jgi:serine protease AprX